MSRNSYYIVNCTECNYRAERYRNAKICPDCGASLIREIQPPAPAIVMALPEHTFHISVLDELAGVLGFDRVCRNGQMVWSPVNEPDLEAAASIINAAPKNQYFAEKRRLTQMRKDDRNVR